MKGRKEGLSGFCHFTISELLALVTSMSMTFHNRGGEEVEERRQHCQGSVLFTQGRPTHSSAIASLLVQEGIH